MLYTVLYPYNDFFFKNPGYFVTLIYICNFVRPLIILVQSPFIHMYDGGEMILVVCSLGWNQKFWKSR